MAGKNEAKIQFKAETAEFENSLKSANQEMSNLKAEMKLAEAQFKNTGDAAEYQKDKQEILEAQLEANAEKQEALASKLEVAKQIYGENSTEVQNLERQLTYAKVEEQNLMAQVNDTNGALDTQKTSTENASSSVDTMAEVIANAGVAEKIKEIAEAAVEMASEFSEASAAIVEGTGASDEALESLNQSAQDAFGSIADSDASLVSVSETLAELNTRFGLTGDEATELTTKISNFAQHTGTDGVSAVDGIADITHRWGLDISDVDGLLDELTVANQSCQLSVGQLTGYLTENSTTFQEMGYSTEDALAMLISLSDGGANVSSVMSGMKKAVANLADVTDDVPGAFQEAISAISECNSVSEALNTEVGDTGKTIEEIFGAKAAQELATNVLNGSFAIDEWTQKLQESDGALESTTENATTMKDAWSQATNNMSMAFNQTLAPTITDVVTGLANVITKVTQVIQKSPALQAVVVGVTVALAALGAALAIESLISAVQKAFALLNLTMYANPIILIVTLIAALVAGLVYAYTHCETFRNAVNTAFEGIKNVITTVINFVKPFIIAAWENIKTSVSVVVEAIGTVIKFVFEAIKTYITIYVTVWKTIITVAWTVISTVVTTAVNVIKNVISTVFNAIKTAITLYVEAWKLIITVAWNVIYTAVSTVINTIKTVVTTVFEAVKNTISTVFEGIKATATTIWGAIKTAITNPIEAAKTIISTTVNAIKSTFSTVLGGIKGTVSSIFEGVKTAITTPIEKAKEKIKSIVDTIKGFFSGAKISWPSISMPHFKISPAGWKVADLLKGSIPKLSIDWYAKGAVFDKPTIIPTINGYKGVGEAGPETVAPVRTLQGYITDAVERATPESIDYNLLGEKVAEAVARQNISMQIDDREFGRLIRGQMA